MKFEEIPSVFRLLVKRYIKVQTVNNSQAQCRDDIMTLRLLFCYISKVEPKWRDIKQLDRKHMENFLLWYREQTNKMKEKNIKYLRPIRTFLDYIQRAQYLEAPEIPYDTPEFLLLGFIHGGQILNLIYQIAVGFIVSYIFYLILKLLYDKRNLKNKRELLEFTYKILIKRLTEFTSE